MGLRRRLHCQLLPSGGPGVGSSDQMMRTQVIKMSARRERPTSQAMETPGGRERPKLDALMHFCCARDEHTHWHVRHNGAAILSLGDTQNHFKLINCTSTLTSNPISNMKFAQWGARSWDMGLRKKCVCNSAAYQFFGAGSPSPILLAWTPKMATAGQPAIWTLLLRS